MIFYETLKKNKNNISYAYEVIKIKKAVNSPTNLGNTRTGELGAVGGRTPEPCPSSGSTDPSPRAKTVRKNHRRSVFELIIKMSGEIQSHSNFNQQQQREGSQSNQQQREGSKLAS